MRLKWEAFCDWTQQNDINLQATGLQDKLQACHSALEVDNDQESLLQAMDEVVHCIQEVQVLLLQFDAAQREKSQTFAYWDEYTKMVQLLLQYLRAERDGLWDLHLDTAASMLPYFLPTAT